VWRFKKQNHTKKKNYVKEIVRPPPPPLLLPLFIVCFHPVATTSKSKPP